MAYERLTLYGLVVNPKRKVHYGKINPVGARELFIRGALVEGDFNTRAQFFQHNRELVEEVEALEAKSRRRDVLVDDQVLFEFYDKRIPEDVCDGRRFEKWRKQAEQKQPKLLYLEKEDLMLHGAGDVTAAQFPDTLEVAGMSFKLSYHFEPGHAEDGVTLTVPLLALNLLTPQRFEWLVPGLLHEKLCQLIKSLPKSLRRNFVPVPNFATACLQALAPSDKSLLEALQQQLFKMSGVRLTSMDWGLSKLTPHMLMNFRVVDDRGGVVAMGRDLLRLQQQLKDKAQQSFAAVPVWEGERENIRAWDFGELPVQIDFERNGVQMRGYPALIDNKESVAIKLRDSLAQAEGETRQALRRLVMFALPDKVKYLNRNLPDLKQMCLYYASVGRCEGLQADLVNAIIDRAFFAGDLPRDERAFAESLERGRQVMLNVANEQCRMVHDILAEHHRLNKALKGKLSAAWLHAVPDIQEQLAHLIYPHFINQTPVAWLREYSRYLKAVNLRLEKLSGGAAARDRAATLEIKPLWQAYLERQEKHRRQGIVDPELECYRWMIEELRVSFFAQELGTKFPISVKRLRQQLDAVP